MFNSGQRTERVKLLLEKEAVIGHSRSTARPRLQLPENCSVSVPDSTLPIPSMELSCVIPPSAVRGFAYMFVLLLCSLYVKTTLHIWLKMNAFYDKYVTASVELRLVKFRVKPFHGVNKIRICLFGIWPRSLIR